MEEVLAKINRGTIVIMLDELTHCHENWRAVATIGPTKSGRTYHLSGTMAWEALAGLVEVIFMYKTRISSKTR